MRKGISGSGYGQGRIVHPCPAIRGGIMKEIQFKDLNIWLKFACAGGFISAAYMIFAFMFGVMYGLMLV